MFRAPALRTHINSNILFNKSSQRHLSTLEFRQKLPNLSQKIFPVTSNEHPEIIKTRSSIQQRIFNEHEQNPFAQKILTGAEHLLSQGKLDIFHAKNVEEDEKAYLNHSALFYFDTIAKTIHLPSAITSPFKFMGFLASPKHNFQRDPESYYVGALIHELTHAVDDLLADLAATKKDKKLIAMDYEYLLNGTDFDYYERPEMRELCHALRKDKLTLETLNKMDEVTAKEILYFIKLIDESMLKTTYLDEMKSYFIQMTTNGAYSSEIIKKYLPETSKWFFEKFVPLMENKMEATNRLSLK